MATSKAFPAAAWTTCPSRKQHSYRRCNLRRSSASATTTASMPPNWGTEIPQEPLLFLKPPSSLLPPWWNDPAPQGFRTYRL